MNDNSTTVADLKRLMASFVAEREWQKFHDPKNLAASIAIETAELMEHFQWLRSDELEAAKHEAATMQAIGEEVADIACYLLSFANTMDIDLASAIEEKVKKNEIKYPVERYRGRSR